MKNIPDRLVGLLILIAAGIFAVALVSAVATLAYSIADAPTTRIERYSR